MTHCEAVAPGSVSQISSIELTVNFTIDLTDPVIDRSTRDTFEETGAPGLVERACEQVERRLAAYQPVDTDPAIDAAMRELILSGLESQDRLPELPPPPEGTAPAGGGRRDGRRRRRRSS